MITAPSDDSTKVKRNNYIYVKQVVNWQTTIEVSCMLREYACRHVAVHVTANLGTLIFVIH